MLFFLLPEVPQADRLHAGTLNIGPVSQLIHPLIASAESFVITNAVP